MTATAVEKTTSDLRFFLQRHTAQSYRPVPLAKAIGEGDIRRVRAALRKMADAGELVSCRIEVPGQGIDEEYRVVAGGLAVKVAPLTAAPHSSPRRPDSSRIPSRMTDLPRDLRTIHQTRPAAASVKRARVNHEAQYSTTPAAKSVVSAEDIPTFKAIATATAPAGAPVAAKVEVTVSSGPATPEEFEKRLQAGNPAWRQQLIADYIEEVQRPVTTSEMLDHFRIARPKLSLATVSSTIQVMRDRGTLVETGKTHEPRRRGILLMAYATPAVAEKFKTNTAGSGGEVTSATPAPITDKAGESPAAPRGADEPARETAQDALQAPQLDAPAAAPANAPIAGQINAQTALDRFFRGCDGNWYGFPWLVRMAGGDVPATLSAIADLQTAGRLVYAEADRAPIWHPVEGCW